MFCHPQSQNERRGNGYGQVIASFRMNVTSAEIPTKGLHLFFLTAEQRWRGDKE